MHSIHTATSKVENSAQILSCSLKFVHGLSNAKLSKVKTTTNLPSTFERRWQRRKVSQNPLQVVTTPAENLNLVFQKGLIIFIFLNIGVFFTKFTMFQTHLNCMTMLYLYWKITVLCCHRCLMIP
jgi:hypothetical protein